MALTLSVTQAPPPSCSEHDLVAAVRHGNDRAFEELFGRYRDRIGSYVFGMLGDRGRAEDIAQEVFISALRRLRDTECPIAFKPWIYQIARNACIDEFRRTRRAKEVPLEFGDEHEGVDHGIPSQTPTPDAAVESKQRLDDLRGAFRGLSESHHRVLVMRELEGLSYEQIGERLGMSKPMVESTLFRARRRLGEEYDELVSGRRCEHVQTLIAAGGDRPLASLGLRERRQFTRHVAHCQPCRRHARMAGVEDSLFPTPGLIGKIAALFPFPWLRWRRSHTDEDPIVASGSHQMAALQSLQTVAQVADPSGPVAGLGRAAATAAAIVIAGAGGGMVAGLGGNGGFPSRGAAAQHSRAPAAGARAVRNVRSGVHGLGAGAPPIIGTASAAGISRVSSTAATASAGSAARGGNGKSGSGSALSGLSNGAASRAQHSVAAAGAAAGTATKGAGLGSLHLPVLGGSGTHGSGLPHLPSVSLPKLPSVPGVGSLGSTSSSSSGPAPVLPPLPTVSTPKLPSVGLPKLPSVGSPSVPGVGSAGSSSSSSGSTPVLPPPPTVSTPKLPPVTSPKLPPVTSPKLPVPSVPNPGGILPKLGSP